VYYSLQEKKNSIEILLKSLHTRLFDPGLKFTRFCLARSFFSTRDFDGIMPNSSSSCPSVIRFACHQESSAAFVTYSISPARNDKPRSPGILGSFDGS
jgi:hypothetical protein